MSKDTSPSLKKTISGEPQLVLIPIDEHHGVVAVVKPSGRGRATCIAFAPATELNKPFQGYRPSFLRKLVTTDLPLREGRWSAMTLDAANSATLRSAVDVLMAEVELTPPDKIRTIDMEQQANISSAPDVALATFQADERVPFEKALLHLVGIPNPTVASGGATQTQAPTQPSTGDEAQA